MGVACCSVEYQYGGVLIMDMLIAACSENKNNHQFFSSRMKSFRQTIIIACRNGNARIARALLRHLETTMASSTLGVRAMLVYKFLAFVCCFG